MHDKKTSHATHLQLIANFFALYILILSVLDLCFNSDPDRHTAKANLFV